MSSRKPSSSKIYSPVPPTMYLKWWIFHGGRGPAQSSVCRAVYSKWRGVSSIIFTLWPSQKAPGDGNCSLQLYRWEKLKSGSWRHVQVLEGLESEPELYSCSNGLWPQMLQSLVLDHPLASSHIQARFVFPTVKSRVSPSPCCTFLNGFCYPHLLPPPQNDKMQPGSSCQRPILGGNEGCYPVLEIDQPRPLNVVWTEVNCLALCFQVLGPRMYCFHP